MSKNGYSFPSTTAEFWNDKPSDVSPFDWLFHPLNPHRFNTWVAKLINRIRHYSRKIGNSFTFFFQRTIAIWLGISEQWLRTIINRLITIGVVEAQKIRGRCQYRINEEVFNITCGLSFGVNDENSPVNSKKQMGYGVAPKSHRNYPINNYTCKESIIKGDDRFPLSDPLKRAFEECQIPTTKINCETTIGLVEHYTEIGVIIGIYISKIRLIYARGRENSQINSIRYCIGAMREYDKANSIKIMEKQGLLATNEYFYYLRKRLYSLTI